MKPPPHSPYDALIVGAGLAGLSCATALHQAGKRVLILESSDRVGGRLRTDEQEGFLLDHGFQVLLTAYDECRRLLDYHALQLGRFQPGAYLWTGRKLEIVADPLRQPSLVFKALASSAGTLGDKLKIAALKPELARHSPEALYQRPERSTRDALCQRGFSETMVDGFLAPFFRGIFLEDELATTSRMFEYVFKTFAQGHAALPSRGMAAIPQQLAEALPPDAIRLDTAAATVGDKSVTTRDGERLGATAVVLAVPMSEASRLSPEIHDRGWNATRCHYFAAPRSPLRRPMIALNASGSGVIRNVSAPSDVSPGYAPNGQSLVCVSVAANSPPGPETALTELAHWFGPQVEAYRFLRSYHLPEALPRQLPGDCPFESAPLQTSDGLWICGDHRYSSSIQGALRSGHKVAEALLA